jgi:two-component system response regulator HydG
MADHPGVAADPILLVDDDDEHLFMLKTVVGDWGHPVKTAKNGKEAFKLAEAARFSLILMDMRMEGDKDGLNTLVRIKEGDGPNRNTPVIIMTAYSQVDDAVNAIKGGAYDYLAKPLDLEVVRHAVDKGLERMATGEVSPSAGRTGRPSSLVGASPAFRAMMEFVGKVAAADSTVLIEGESGVGKEMVARAVQSGSRRASKPFETINCAALAETLLESELFGHVRGAFTGAESNRDGRLKVANGGTVFLDEIAETSNGFQAKLLRTIQEGEIQPLGSNHVERVNVRFIAATNQDLEKSVREGRFREDLFYRLNVLTVRVPPLRERPEDLELLARHFVSEYARKNDRSVSGIDAGALAAIRRYFWPGNIRELQNAMERAVILAKGDVVTEDDLVLRYGSMGGLGALGSQRPASPQTPLAPQAPSEAQEAVPDSPGSPEEPMSLEESEKIAVSKAIARHGGNKTRAAQELGVTRKTLAAKIRKYGIE